MQDASQFPHDPATAGDYVVTDEMANARIVKIEGALKDVLRDFSNSGFRAYEVRNVYTPDEYPDRVPALPPKRLIDVSEKQIHMVLSRQNLAAL